MDIQNVWKRTLVVFGVLMVLYLAYGLTERPKQQYRAHRITAINKAPTVSITFSTSNMPAGWTNLLPNR